MNKPRYGANYRQTKKVCERCGVEFSRYIAPSRAAEGRYRYCSRKCSSSTPESDARKKCTGCGQELNRCPPADGRMRFCSRRCKADWKLRVNTKKDDATGCINWDGNRFGDGYGVLYFDGNRGAHRVAWVIAKGEIPQGMHVCHSCDNPSCCNIEHLFLSSHAGNMADRNAKGRSGSYKLSRSDVEVIMRRVQAGEPLKEIAADFPVSYSAVLRISKKAKQASTLLPTSCQL